VVAAKGFTGVFFERKPAERHSLQIVVHINWYPTVERTTVAVAMAVLCPPGGLRRFHWFAMVHFLVVRQMFLVPVFLLLHKSIICNRKETRYRQQTLVRRSVLADRLGWRKEDCSHEIAGNNGGRQEATGLPHHRRKSRPPQRVPHHTLAGKTPSCANTNRTPSLPCSCNYGEIWQTLRLYVATCPSPVQYMSAGGFAEFDALGRCFVSHHKFVTQHRSHHTRTSL
jgi:hypothetical protein